MPPLYPQKLPGKKLADAVTDGRGHADRQSLDAGCAWRACPSLRGFGHKHSGCRGFGCRSGERPGGVESIRMGRVGNYVRMQLAIARACAEVWRPSWQQAPASSINSLISPTQPNPYPTACSSGDRCHLVVAFLESCDCLVSPSDACSSPLPPPISSRHGRSERCLSAECRPRTSSTRRCS